MGHQRDARRAAKRKAKTLHVEDDPPSDDADQDGCPHENQRGQLPAEVYAGDGLPQAGRADGPAFPDLLGQREVGPVSAPELEGVFRFTGEDGVQNPRHQNDANRQFQREYQCL